MECIIQYWFNRRTYVIPWFIITVQPPLSFLTLMNLNTSFAVSIGRNIISHYNNGCNQWLSPFIPSLKRTAAVVIQQLWLSVILLKTPGNISNMLHATCLLYISVGWFSTTVTHREEIAFSHRRLKLRSSTERKLAKKEKKSWGTFKTTRFNYYASSVELLLEDMSIK